ncbi:MAG: hypothetical protein PVI63_08380 [Anaerolineae bacterium]|jgi:hypothetical protein
MTSRDVSRTRLQEQLDVKIQWALRASWGHARPPAHIWKRIVERLVGHQAVVIEVSPWRELYGACQSLELWLVDLAVNPFGEFAYSFSPGLSDVQGLGYLRLLVYPGDFPMLSKAI